MLDHTCKRKFLREKNSSSKIGGKLIFDVQHSKKLILREEGHSERKTTVKTGCSKTAVHTVINNFLNEVSYSDKKRKYSCRHDNMIKLTVSRFHTSSLNKVQGSKRVLGNIASMFLHVQFLYVVIANVCFCLADLFGITNCMFKDY